MRFLSSLRTAFLAATAALLSAGAHAGPMPTNVAAIKSMVDQNTTEVRWRGGYGYRGVGYRGGGYGYRGGGYRGGGWAYRGGVGYRGGLGYRGWGYRGLGYGAVAGAAIARRGYYGGYYGGDGGYPSYSYAAAPYGYGGGYGYGGSYGYGSDYCPPDDDDSW
jgi:hypothetical protein